MSILSELKKFLKGGNLIVSTRLEKYETTLIQILKFLIKKKRLKGILLTVNKPYKGFIPTLEENKISLDNLVFIDCISSTEDKKEGNCIYLKTPFSPTKAAIRLNELTKKPEIKFIIFDTLTTLLTYDSMTIVKFFQSTLSNFLMGRKITIVLGIDVDTKDIETKLIAQFCNKIIKV